MIELKDLEAYFPEAEEHYRYLHRHPELGFEEKNTSDYIMERLAEYGISGKRVARTGVTADIVGA